MMFKKVKTNLDCMMNVFFKAFKVNTLVYFID